MSLPLPPIPAAGASTSPSSSVAPSSTLPPFSASLPPRPAHLPPVPPPSTYAVSRPPPPFDHPVADREYHSTSYRERDFGERDPRFDDRERDLREYEGKCVSRRSFGMLTRRLLGPSTFRHQLVIFWARSDEPKRNNTASLKPDGWETTVQFLMAIPLLPCPPLPPSHLFPSIPLTQPDRKRRRSPSPNGRHHDVRPRYGDERDHSQSLSAPRHHGDAPRAGSGFSPPDPLSCLHPTDQFLRLDPRSDPCCLQCETLGMTRIIWLDRLSSTQTSTNI